jgi:uncharacterized protein
MANQRAKKGAVPDATMAFTELSSSDSEATRRFLEEVFGWSFTRMKMLGGEYLSFEAPGGRGGIRPTRPTEMPNSMNYVRVPDLDAALRKIKVGGGEVVLPRVDVPGMGSFFWFRIPGGPLMACWQDAPEQSQEK